MLTFSSCYLTPNIVAHGDGFSSLAQILCPFPSP
jgi:hypothetical protein